MITEEGVVVAADNDQVIIEVRRKSTCGSCQAKSACGTSLIESLFSRRSRFTVDNSINAEIGDKLVLSISEKDVVRSSVRLYLWPLAGLIGGAMLFDLLAIRMAMAPELFQLAGGLLGMTAVLLLLRSLGKKEKQIRIHLGRAPLSVNADEVPLKHMMR